jgi:hypothetical protein
MVLLRSWIIVDLASIERIDKLIFKKIREKHRGFVGKGHRFKAIQRSGARIPHLYSDDDVRLFWWGWFVKALGVRTRQ